MSEIRDFQDDLVLSVEELIGLKEVQRRIGSARSADEVLRILMRQISTIVRTHEIMLCLVDRDKTEFRVCRNPEKGHVFPAPIQAGLLDNEVIRWITRWGRPTTLPLGPHRLMTIVPLLAQSQLVGIVYIDSQAEDEVITRQVQEMLTFLANQAASVLLALRLYDQLQQQLAAVSRSTTLLGNILESIHHGVITVSRDLTIEHVNRNALAMLDVPWGMDAIGKKLDQVMPPDVLDIVHGIIDETLANGFALERQAVIHLGSGPQIRIAVSTSTLVDDAGATNGVVVTLRDMTASMELERLRQIDQMKDEFVANVSHELRTPLTCIKAYTEALFDMVEKETQAHKFLGVIDMESDRLIALIQNLLDVSLMASGRFTLDLQIVHPPEIVTEIQHLSKLKSDKHSIAIELAPELPKTLMDKPRMKEVMVNLIGNAIKYSPDGGAITVSMSVEDQNLRIGVADRGPGIGDEHKEKIFDRFYRIDSSLTYKVSGTGLGLAIVKKVVEAHDGSIRVTDNPGGGSVFTVRLPIRTRARPKFD